MYGGIPSVRTRVARSVFWAIIARLVAAAGRVPRVRTYSSVVRRPTTSLSRSSSVPSGVNWRMTTG